MTQLMSTLSEVTRNLRAVELTLVGVAEELKDLPDHEQRIRSLERWRYALPATLISSIVAAAAAVVGAWGR